MPTTRTSRSTPRPSQPPGTAGATIYLATPRIENPHEANLFRYLAKQGADGMLVRNAGGMAFCAERSIPFVADFSLNAANALTVELPQEPRAPSRHGLVRPATPTSSSI